MNDKFNHAFISKNLQKNLENYQNDKIVQLALAYQTSLSNNPIAEWITICL